jgi:hypothetical protein
VGGCGPRLRDARRDRTVESLRLRDDKRESSADALATGVISLLRDGHDVEAVIRYLLHDAPGDRERLIDVAAVCRDRGELPAARSVLSAIGTGLFTDRPDSAAGG